jgi:hypothetical protein
MNREPVDNRHPVDFLEPEEEPALTSRALVLARMLDIVFPAPTSQQNQGERFEAAFRRFVAICMIVRPELFGGASQITIAKFTGCTSANLSKLLCSLADQLGIQAPSMESDESRQRRSIGQLKRKKPSSHGVNADAKHQHSVDLAVVQAKKKIQIGKPWTKFERLALWERGLVDDDGNLSPEGQEYLGKGAASPASPPGSGAPVRGH